MNTAFSPSRNAVLTLFFINGFVLSSWVPHIPLIQERLQLSEGILGLALLALAAGAITLMPLSGAWSSRFGSGRVTLMAAVLFCATLPLPILAPHFISLLPALFLFGACNGTMDVAMNAHAVAVEKKQGQPIMSSFHGVFSLGGLSGAALGGWALSRGVSPKAHVFVVSGIMITAAIYAARFLLPHEEKWATKPSTFSIPTGPLRLLGALAFLVLLAEGAIMDWSTVYIKNILQTHVGLAAAGYAAFSLMMAAGRLAGNRLILRWGAPRMMRVTALFAASGLVLAIIIRQPLFAIIGFGCVGLGLSNLTPVIFSAAGRTPGVASSIGISAVATAGYVGFLAGPPLIGCVAELTSLPIALGFVAMAMVLVSCFTRLIAPSQQNDSPDVEGSCNELS